MSHRLAGSPRRALRPIQPRSSQPAVLQLCYDRPGINPHLSQYARLLKLGRVPRHVSSPSPSDSCQKPPAPPHNIHHPVAPPTLSRMLAGCASRRSSCCSPSGSCLLRSSVGWYSLSLPLCPAAESTLDERRWSSLSGCEPSCNPAGREGGRSMQGVRHVGRRRSFGLWKRTWRNIRWWFLGTGCRPQLRLCSVGAARACHRNYRTGITRRHSMRIRGEGCGRLRCCANSETGGYTIARKRTSTATPRMPWEVRAAHGKVQVPFSCTPQVAAASDQNQQRSTSDKRL